MSWTIVRPGTVYGPGDEVISTILKIVRSLQLVEDGNGSMLAPPRRGVQQESTTLDATQGAQIEKDVRSLIQSRKRDESVAPERPA